ncbi:MAG: hypothetical protein ACYTG6_11960 [Planctomycetota bacterium]|jgi:hypothetical protein
MRHTSILLVLLLLAGVASGDDAPSPRAIQEAIGRGADWLTAHASETFRSEKWHDTLELTMYTLAHTNVDRTSEVYQEGLQKLQTCKLAYTYRVAMLAMALEHINPWLYRQRLVGCAQWLVDTQLAGGEWGYPGSIQGPDVQPTPIPAEPLAEGEVEGAGREPIVIERQSDPASFGDAKGDFSNTQFAILGLRACRDAKIEIPKETWQAALDYMLAFQQEDGGWGYVYAGEQDGASYASLTCAGIVGAAICLHALGKTPRSHPAVKKALRWLGKHWDATRNVGLERSNIIGPSTWQYYHL